MIVPIWRYFHQLIPGIDRVAWLERLCPNVIIVIVIPQSHAGAHRFIVWRRRHVGIRNSDDRRWWRECRITSCSIISGKVSHKTDVRRLSSYWWWLCSYWWRQRWRGSRNWRIRSGSDAFPITPQWNIANDDWRFNMKGKRSLRKWKNNERIRFLGP